MSEPLVAVYSCGFVKLTTESMLALQAGERNFSPFSNHKLAPGRRKHAREHLLFGDFDRGKEK